MNEIVEITTHEVERRLIALRGQKVLLDRDVAELYGVQTKEINQLLRTTRESFVRVTFLNLPKMSPLL